MARDCIRIYFRKVRNHDLRHKSSGVHMITFVFEAELIVKCITQLCWLISIFHYLKFQTVITFIAEDSGDSGQRMGRTLIPRQSEPCAPLSPAIFCGASKKCFKNRFLSFPTSYVLTPTVIIYIFNVIDSLGNYIFINICYSLISRILRGEIYRRRT